MRLLILVLLFLSAVLLLPQQAHAHVLIIDGTNSKGAVLHISPDDDPIAGQTTSLFFDMQDQDISSLNLTISGTDSKVPVPLNISGSLATAEYVFPVQGVYDLAFTAQTGGTSYTFNHSQRVSRGVGNGALDKPGHAWAEMLLVASGIGLLTLLIIAINRRSAILLQSKW